MPVQQQQQPWCCLQHRWPGPLLQAWLLPPRVLVVRTSPPAASPAASSVCIPTLKTFLEHAHESEHKMLPALRSALDDDALHELGKRYQAAKQHLPTR